MCPTPLPGADLTTNLSNFSAAGIDYGTTYDVEVFTWVGTTTNLSGPAAVSCSVITPVLETQVQSSQCNTTLSALNTPIYADNISGATGFRYELVNTSTSLTQTFEKTTGTLNAFSLSDFPSSFINVFSENTSITHEKPTVEYLFSISHSLVGIHIHFAFG